MNKGLRSGCHWGKISLDNNPCEESMHRIVRPPVLQPSSVHTPFSRVFRLPVPHRQVGVFLRCPPKRGDLDGKQVPKRQREPVVSLARRSGSCQLPQSERQDIVVHLHARCAERASRPCCWETARDLACWGAITIQHLLLPMANPCRMHSWHKVAIPASIPKNGSDQKSSVPGPPILAPGSRSLCAPSLKILVVPSAHHWAHPRTKSPHRPHSSSSPFLLSCPSQVPSHLIPRALLLAPASVTLIYGFRC